jgi:uncharacterized Zn finger protein (UPF0148 family)
MNSCPICGTELSEERPRHNVSLEFHGQTRSAAQQTGDSISTEANGDLQRQLCSDCWDDIREEITDD